MTPVLGTTGRTEGWRAGLTRTLEGSLQVSRLEGVGEVAVTVSDMANQLDQQHAAATEVRQYWDGLYAIQAISVGSRLRELARALVRALTGMPYTQSIHYVEENGQPALWVRVAPWRQPVRYAVYELRRSVDSEYAVGLYLMEDDDEAPQNALVVLLRRHA